MQIPIQIMRQRANEHGVAEVKWMDMDNADGSHMSIANAQVSTAELLVYNGRYWHAKCVYSSEVVLPGKQPRC